MGVPLTTPICVPDVRGDSWRVSPGHGGPDRQTNPLRGRRVSGFVPK